ncbi:MAG: hypothetical protein ACKOXV_06830 [Bacteroidota bacterium]|jgi:hypothetical protein
MKTASLINNIMIASNAPEVSIGTGATKLMYTDRYPFTVIDVINENTLVLQADDYERVDNNGMSDCQEYVFTQNPTNPTYIVTKRKNGYWVTKGQGLKNGQHWSIGTRSRHFDFSF